MSKHSLLTNRLLMAQGAIALLQKNVEEALTLAQGCVKVEVNETGDQEQLEIPFFNEVGEPILDEDRAIEELPF